MPESVVSARSADHESSACGCCCCFPKKAKRKSMENGIENLENDQKVAYTSDLPPKTLHVGITIAIKGAVQANCSRFAVNLTCGKGPSPDIAFHFNPRVTQRYIVRNSRLNGQWGDEETTLPVKFDFFQEKEFMLELFVGQGEFLVALNSVHLCAFRFRVPLGKVTGIQVLGCVDVHRVDYREVETYPPNMPQNRPVAEGRRGEPGDDDVPETAMDTPVTFLLPEGFQQDWQLEIYGRIKILPHSFYINLQEGSHHWPHPIIPLHLNPRFGTGVSEPLFVRNAWIDGRWGQEERAPGFQFTPGSPFTIAIRRGNDHFSVWIDGKLAGEFKFRTPCDKIDTVHIQGDVVIYRVGLEKDTK